jgi:hypothetical protein
MNVGNDGVISINSNQQTNIYQFLSLDSSTPFQSASVMGNSLKMDIHILWFTFTMQNEKMESTLIIMQII